MVARMRVVDLATDDPLIGAYVAAYREKWMLGAYMPETSRAEKWRAITYDERVVAVIGERLSDPGVLEVADVYCEPSRYGLVAVYAMGLAWKALLAQGAIQTLRATVLYANKRMWKAIVRETKVRPWALIFEFRRSS
jgi:hypothetical protein